MCNTFEESKEKLVWKNVDGNLLGYEQFKLDKLSSYRNGWSEKVSAVYNKRANKSVQKLFETYLDAHIRVCNERV